MRKIISLFLAVALTVPMLVGMAATPAWPMPFFDNSHSNCAPNITTTLPLERAWVFFTDSKKLGMPVCTEENVYVSDNTGTIYCLSRDLGEEVWRYNLGLKRPTTISIVGGNIVFITTSTDINTMYSGMGAGGRRNRRGGGGRSPGQPEPPKNGEVTEDEPRNFVGVLDLATGKAIVPQKELILEDLMLAHSTIVGENMYLVYISLDEKFNSGPSKIVCMSLKDLSTTWAVDFPKLIAMPPAVDSGKLITESVKTTYNEDTQSPEMSDAELDGINISDGSVAWTKKLDTNEILMMPSCSNGVFYMPKIIMPDQNSGGGGGGGGGGGFRMPDSFISAFKVATGEEIWSRQLPAADPAKRDMGDIAFGIPAVTPKGIIIQCMISKTMLFDKETGDLKWSTPTSGGFSMTGMQYVCTGTYVISTRGSKLSFINLGSGEEVYVEDLKFQAGMPIGGVMPTYAFPCVSNDMVYIAADKLMAYSKKIVGIKSDPTVVRFEQIETGTTKMKPFRVIYNGDGEISGNLEVNQPWMKLKNTSFTNATQNYELTIDATKLEPGEYKGEVTIKSSVGEGKVPVNVRVVPKPPLKLEINLDEEVLTNVNPYKVTGLTVPGAKLTISGRPATVATDGTFKEDIPLKEGLNRLTFEATDAKGAKAVAIRIIFLDTKKPLLQVSLTNGQVFMEQPVKFSGRTEPGIKLRVNEQPVEISETGEFEAVIENLEDGEHKVTIVATDKAGNVSTMEKTIVVDMKPLELTLELPPEPIFTNQPTYKIKGTTRPDTRIVASFGQSMVGMAVADEEGKFELEVKFPDEGEFQINIRAQYDQKSAQKSVSIVYDKTPPAIKCDLPATTDKQSLTIYAMTDPGLEVTVTVGADKKVVKSDANGKFQASFSLKPGLNPVTMTTRDMAGNEGKFNGFVKYEEKKQVQKVAIVLTLDKTDWTLNGVAQSPLKVAPTSTKLPADLKGNTYMPIKEVAQALFAEVGWDANEKKVTLTQKLPDGSTNIVELWIGKKTARINGKEVPISSSGKLYPVVYEGKTILPLRFVADALGCSTNYEAATKKITLNFPK